MSSFQLSVAVKAGGGMVIEGSRRMELFPDVLQEREKEVH